MRKQESIAVDNVSDAGVQGSTLYSNGCSSVFPIGNLLKDGLLLH